MSDAELKELCEEVLEEVLFELDLSVGIVSKIDGASYSIVAVKSDTGVFKAGEAFELKDTYCREVIEKRQTIALTQLDDTPGLCKHPLYSGLPLESYISAPIMMADKVWGTLNFSSMITRESEFSLEEIELVETRAKQISEFIDRAN